MHLQQQEVAPAFKLIRSLLEPNGRFLLFRALDTAGSCIERVRPPGPLLSPASRRRVDRPTQDSWLPKHQVTHQCRRYGAGFNNLAYLYCGEIRGQEEGLSPFIPPNPHVVFRIVGIKISIWHKIPDVLKKTAGEAHISE